MTAPKKRKSPAVRRREILQATIAVGRERGLDALTLRDIAERTGVTPGLIHHYFPSMDSLITEAFGGWADEALAMLSAQEKSATPRMALALVVMNVGPEQRLWYDALITASRFELLRDRARRLSQSYHSHVASLIRAGVGDGSFRCSDPETTAWRIILMLDGLVPMSSIVRLLELREIPEIVGPFIERELGLGDRTFTDLLQALLPKSSRDLADSLADAGEAEA